MAAAPVATIEEAAEPAPWRPDLAAARALMLLCLASLWVGFAAASAATVIITACEYDEACLVYRVLATTSIRALVFAALLAPISPLLVLRCAICDAGFREELIISLIRHLQTMTRREGIEFEDRKELHHLALNVTEVGD